MIAAGLALLCYLSLGARAFETALIVLSVVLVACGIAAARDVVFGSSRILWVVAHPGPAAERQRLLEVDAPGSLDRP